MPNPSEIQEHVEEEIAREDFGEFLREIEQSRSRRFTAKRQPKIVEWKTDRAQDPVSFGFKPPEGSIMCFWSRKSNDLLNKLESAYITHDVHRLNELYDEVFESDLKDRPLLSLEEAKEDLLDSDAFFDFRYGEKTLANSLWESEETGFGAMVFPYSGGEVQKEKFRIVEHFADHEDTDCSPYKTLVVVTPPVLSDIEKRALEAVPPEMEEVNIARPDPVANTVMIWIAVRLALITLAGSCDAPFEEKLQQVGLPPELLEEMSSTAAVERLVEMRVEVFQEFNVK